VVGVELAFAVWESYNWEPSDDWRRAGPVAVSPRWSIALEEQSSHPFLAEYNYRLRVFANDERRGEQRGTVDLHPNTGGRTHLCLFSLTSSTGMFFLEIRDRNQSSLIDLESLSLVSVPPVASERHLLGEFVEDSPPLRFLPAGAESSCPWGA
jgi:hypothetical protein